MADARQLVDASLGVGRYDQWQQMDRQLVDEGNRFDFYRAKLQLGLSSPLSNRLYEDLTLLNRIAKDHREGMNRIANALPVNKDKLEKLFNLYSLSLGVVENQNDILEALFATGFAAALVLFPFALLQAKSQLLLQALGDLREELKEAEHELKNAHNKRAFHLAVAFFEAMFPEISLTARVTIFLSDVAMDKALGPKEPTAAQKYTGIVTPGVKQFSEAVHHIEDYGETAHEIAHKTGKIATVATFYFDFKEIGEGQERVEKLTELTEKVKTAYDSVVKVIDDNKPALVRLVSSYERWMQAIEDVRLTAANIRSALTDDMAKYGYSKASAALWVTAP